MKRWFPAALLAVAFPAIPADDAATLAARAEAILDRWDGDRKQLEEARVAIEEAVKLDPASLHYKGLQGRQILLAGTVEEGIRPSAFNAALPILTRAAFTPPGDPRATAFVVPLRLAIGQDDGFKLLKMAEAAAPGDPWIHWSWAKYHQAHRDQAAQLAALEKAVALGLQSPIELRRAFDELLPAYAMRGERDKLDAAYVARIKLDPRDPWLRSDMARDVMVGFGDFSAGEKYAREAAAMRDDPQARQMISLSLYGQWAQAARDGKPADFIAARFKAASANDPGGRLLPSCLAAARSLQYVYQRLEEKNIRQEGMTSC